jgi:hypothetical protein
MVSCIEVGYNLLVVKRLDSISHQIVTFQILNPLTGNAFWPFSIHCRRFARVGEAIDFNLVKNQSRGHAKKGKCSSTSKRVRAHKSRQKTLRLNTFRKS